MFAAFRIHAELERLRDENRQLKQQLARETAIFRQWENLLGYDGSPQPDHLGGDPTGTDGC